MQGIAIFLLRPVFCRRSKSLKNIRLFPKFFYAANLRFLQRVGKRPRRAAKSSEGGYAARARCGHKYPDIRAGNGNAAAEFFARKVCGKGACAACADFACADFIRKSRIVF
ncbi:MAG: hypothetical protein DBX55_09355 [Verrucomicrobia bacterium]|nr:MAG: hypothetical protein DBX55_09355 [Verrucomicrobiota bacterium]